MRLSLGDPDSTEMEFDAAHWVLAELGAAPDVARVRALSRTAAATADSLTAREAQVLRLVAKGMPTGRSPPSCTSARRRWPGT